MDHMELKKFVLGIWIWYLEARSRYWDFGNICFEFSLECSGIWECCTLYVHIVDKGCTMHMASRYWNIHFLYLWKGVFHHHSCQGKPSTFWIKIFLHRDPSTASFSIHQTAFDFKMFIVQAFLHTFRNFTCSIFIWGLVLTFMQYSCLRTNLNFKQAPEMSSFSWDTHRMLPTC